MDRVEVSIPAKYQVRRLIREQRACKRTFRDWIDEAWKNDWQRSRIKLKGVELQSFASDFEGRMAAAGLFDASRRNTPAVLALKSERSYDVGGFALWPISLGQNAETPHAYAEDALMLVRLNASFSNKKTVVSEAPYLLGMTRHALERFVERGAVAGELYGQLVAAMPHILYRTAMTLAFGVAKVVEGDEFARTVYVPFGGGLLVVTNRLLAGPLYSQDFGWSFSFTKARFVRGYLKRDLVAPDDANGSYRARGGALVSAWFVTTYLASNQLTQRQADYVSRCSRWIEGAATSTIDHAVDVQFNPDHVFRPEQSCRYLVESGDGIEEGLRAIAESETFKYHRREALAHLLDDDTDTRKLRSILASHSHVV